MEKILAFLQGKKTYIIAVVGAVVSLLLACGVTIPDWAWGLLGFLGLGALRSGVNKSGPTDSTPTK